VKPPNLNLRQLFPIIVLAVLAILTLLPFYCVICMSQKTNGEILNHFWALPTRLNLECFAQAWHFIRSYIQNSLLISAISVVGTVFLSSLGGYVFARLEFGGKHVLFLLLLALMMVPGLLTLVPSFLWFKGFPLVGGNNWLGEGGRGFLNTRWVLILPSISGGQILGIFLCRTFFENLPQGLFEAARIDGASEWRAYWRIALPLSLPVLATLAIMQFVGVYNDYVWPLLTITSDQLQVFAVGVTKFGAEGNLDYAPLMAGYMLGALPLVLVFGAGMKYYIEGLTQGAMKG
jgi:multiple sugar transport system permease protein